MTLPGNSRSNVHRRQVESQVRYFAERRPDTMRVEDTPYIRRHFAEASARVGLRPGERVCEWGAGMGRFSSLFLQRGCQLTAVELSPALAARCAEVLGDSADARLLTGDVLEVCASLQGEFDLVAGFFMLHHLPSLEPYLVAARTLLRPGGRMVFVEPNPLNPLYPVQITLTPSMRWAEEGGIYRLWPHRLRHAAAAAGLREVQVQHYGALPRQPYNGLARLGLERVAERLVPASLRPFTLFSASL